VQTHQSQEMNNFEEKEVNKINIWNFWKISRDLVKFTKCYVY